MSIRVSLLWFACVSVLSYGCGDSTTDRGNAGVGGMGGEAHGGSNQSGSHSGGNGNQSGSGGDTTEAGADSAIAGQAGADSAIAGRAGAESVNAGQAGTSASGASNAGAGGDAEGGAAGRPEPSARFEPWALWPMPNAASAGLPNPAHYDANDAGVVRDQVTGLLWQAQAPSVAYDWSGAKGYCASLVLAGFGDWRLPSRIELISIVDYTIAKPGPVLDAAAFPGQPNTIFWTASTLTPYGTTRAWYVEFDNGFAFSESTTVKYSVRCVR